MDEELSQLSSRQVKITEEVTLVIAEPDHLDSTEVLKDENENLKREYPYALRSQGKLQQQDAWVELDSGRG